MKQPELSLEQMMEVAAYIGNKNSATVVNIGGLAYTVKSVQESISGFYSDLVNGKVLDSSNTKKIGLRTIKGNTLPQGVTQFVQKIGVFSEKPASGATAKSDTLLMDAVFASTPFAGFANGQLIFDQNAQLTRLAGAAVSQYGTPANVDDVLRNVAPFILRGGDGSPFEIEMILVGTAPTANFAYKLVWDALEFTPANNG